MKAYPNQWQQLQRVKKISKAFIEKKINEWSEDGILGVLADEENADGEEKEDKVKDTVEGLKKSKPWKKKTFRFHPEDVLGQVHIVLANGIYIEKENFQPRMQNTLRRMAAYSNPQYYKKSCNGFFHQR